MAATRDVAILIAAVLAAGWTAPAAASGGAHVVDDSEVETAGTCHLESWGSAGSGRLRVVNLSPACTFRLLPRVELGGFLNRWSTPRAHGTLVGVAPKATLRPAARGLGIGLSGNVALDARTGRVASAALTVPVTVPLAGGVRANLNAGWDWTRGAGQSALAGAQLEVPLRADVAVMVEALGRTRGRAGGQTGVRWTVDGGRMDLDLLASRYVDGATRDAVTLGLTIRR